MKSGLSPGRGGSAIGWWSSRRDRSARWWFPSSRLYLAGKGLHSLVQICPSRIVRDMWSCRVKVCKSGDRDRSALRISRVDESSIRMDLC
jgi:hypothetical protein